MKSIFTALFVFVCFFFLKAQQPGTLDPSFGNKGTFVDSADVNVAGEIAMKVTKSGRILIGTGGPYKGFTSTFEIDAYLPNGSHDLSFGDHGSVYVVFPDMKTAEDYAFIGSLALLPDGRILACGSRYAINSYSYVAFARFKPDGTVDSTFGTNGMLVESDFEENTGYEGHGVISIMFQPDGKLVTAGRVTLGAGQSMNRISTARYLPDGGLDSSYGYNGITISSEKGAAYAVILQKDGKVVSAGYSGFGNVNSTDAHFHLERYNPNGSFDKSFGTNGIINTQIGVAGSIINDVVIQEDGKIVVIGNAPTFTIARYNTDGSLDQSFGEGGIMAKTFTQNAKAQKVFITGEKKDKIVAIGYIADFFTGSGDFAVAGYNLDGSLDPEFGNGGIQTTDFNSNDYSYSADLQTDGKIVQFGNTFSNNASIRHRAFTRYYGYPQKVSLYVKVKRWLQNHAVVYPNPASNYITVSGLSSTNKTTLVITDAVGKAMAIYNTANANSYTIDISRLLAGVYYVPVITTVEKQSIKFVKE